MGARKMGARTAAPVIATKLAIPRRRGDTLRRPRLLDAIHHQIDRQLFLVVAPAGYGKTTLLVDFAADGGIPVCWYSLSPSDAEPALFLDYLVASIQARFPRFGNETRRVMAQAINFRIDGLAVVAALINEVQERIHEYFAVVLDDYHEVNENPAINQLVDALLKHAPENLKLIVASRTMPKLQLSRLAALRQAAGVGAGDLRFTSEEVRDLMRDAYQTVLPDRVVEELTARSEGWITGIILTTHTMWQGLFESMIRNSGQEQLYSYLASEVFARQTPAVQRFLLASSVLDDMEASVAGPLAGTSRAEGIFRQLKDGNLFVTELEGRKRVYRYHHLFRDFLRSRLDEGALGLSRPKLERRAGQLFQEQGEHEQAIGHLLAADAFLEAAESILAIAEETFNAGRLDTLAGWIDRLPDSIRAAQPMLIVWRARVSIQRGELDKAVECCDAAHRAATLLGDSVAVGEANVHRAAALRLLGDNEQALELSQGALTAIGPLPSSARALALRTIGLAYWRLGELNLAWTNVNESLRVFEELGDSAAVAYAHNDLGAVAMFRGELGEARHHLGRSARFWERAGNAGRHGLALSNLGVVAYLQEEYQESSKLLELGLNKGRAGLFPHTEVVAACSLGDLHRDLGDFPRAESLYAQAMSVAEELGDRGEYATVLWSMANGQRLQEQYARAEGTIRRAMRIASGYRAAQLKLTSAVCAIEQGRFRRAERLLGDALAVFESGGARYAVARTLFYQALLGFQVLDLEGSDNKLAECLNILEDLGFSQFLSVDGRRCLPFLEQAARRGIGDQFLPRLIRRLKRPLVAPNHEPSMQAQLESIPRLQIRTFGATEVRVDRRLVPAKEWGAQSARELLIYLMLHREGVRREQLLAAMAPESSQARANSQFHVAAYRIRQALYKNAVRFDGDVYQVDPDLECEFDVEEFLTACSAAKAAAPGSGEEASALQRAAALYGGHFLEGCYSDWAIEEQRRLEEHFLTVLGRLARLHLIQGDFDAAYMAAGRALEVDNGLEELHELAIRALVSAGKLAEAYRHLSSYTAYLRDELGEEPPEALTQLVATAQSGRRLAAVV